MKLFTFLGTEVRAHWSLLIPFAITMFSPMHFYIIGLAFALVVLHEYGHIVMARRFGVNCEKVYLSCIGGMAVLDNEPPTPKAAFLTAWAGPMVNVVLIAFGFLCASIVPHSLLVPFICVNLFIVAFNSIPAFPMDGGRVLHAILWWLFGRRMATRLCVSLSVGLASFGLLYGVYAGEWTLVLVSAFVAFAAGSSWNEENVEERTDREMDSGPRAGRPASQQDRELLRPDTRALGYDRYVRRAVAEGVQTQSDGRDGEEVEGTQGS